MSSLLPTYKEVVVLVANRQARRKAAQTRKALTLVPEPGDRPVGLNMIERLTVGRMLPAQGDYLTLMTVRRCHQALEFSDEEIAFLEGTATEQPNGGRTYSFDSEQAQEEVEITLSPQAFVLIQKTLKELDEKKQLTAAHLSLWEKFVAPPEASGEGDPG